MRRSKYSRINVTPAFETAYAAIADYLKTSSPLAFMALPAAMTTILDTIDSHPYAWPVRRKTIGAREVEFHLAIVPVAYRRLYLRYSVDTEESVYLLAIWVDGHDEPTYWSL